MVDTPQTLKSRLYKLQTVHDQETWVQKCQGYPIFKRQDSIFKLKYYSLPNRELCYQIVVNSNIKFDKNQNGVQWIQIREGEIMAISFKQEFSANAFWNLIDQYQKRYQVTVPAAIGTHFYFQYRVPDPTVNNLHQFLAEIQRIPQNQRHERLTSILLTKRQFLPHLYSVLKKLEQAQVKDITKLQMMFKIMKIIFNSSNQQLLYELVMDESYYSVLGALQYDPNFRNARPSHREYMQNRVKMISVVPFKNTDLLNICIVTQRIQYLRQCVLLPYLNDYSFTYTSIIIRNNYKRIIGHIFNPKKKEFINDLFDHLRRQDVMAYKLLRQIFRIGKNISAEDFYLHLAERDFFDIMLKNMRDLKQMQQNNNVVSTDNQANNRNRRRRRPQQIAQCVQISIQILQQFMQYEPLHFKNFCTSQNEKISKFPTISFLLDHYQNSQSDIKMENILKILISDKQNHAIKAITHEKIVTKYLAKNSFQNMQKWILLLNKIVSQISTLIDDTIQQLFKITLQNIKIGSKQHQINMLTCLKNLVDNYIDQDERIESLLVPNIDKFIQYFIGTKGSRGIRVSIYESMFKGKKLRKFVQLLIQKLQQKNDPLMKVSIRVLKNFLTRQEVNLPTNLKRERSQQLHDDETFEKIEKRIKID